MIFTLPCTAARAQRAQLDAEDSGRAQRQPHAAHAEERIGLAVDA